MVAQKLALEKKAPNTQNNKVECCKVVALEARLRATDGGLKVCCGVWRVRITGEGPNAVSERHPQYELIWRGGGGSNLGD